MYGVVAIELETFLARQQERDRSVPRFAGREFRSFLTCGILEHGIIRVHCDSCGKDHVVPYSCKRRGWRPSCGGRRMADTAARLVDLVLPWVPVRHWVLSLPFALRYRTAYDSWLIRTLARHLHNNGALLTEASRLFERVRDLQDAEVLFIAADDLHANRKSFRREAARHRGRWIACCRDVPAGLHPVDVVGELHARDLCFL